MAQIWILMKGRSKMGGLVCGIAKTENEQDIWENSHKANWAVQVDTEKDAMFSSPMNGAEEAV